MLNYEDAKTNCAQKLAIHGKEMLYEPQSHKMNQMVAEKANEIFGFIDGSFWIGVTRSNTYNFVYDSNSMPLNFTPKWVELASDATTAWRCIFVFYDTWQLGKWQTYICFADYYSVCELVMDP